MFKKKPSIYTFLSPAIYAVLVFACTYPLFQNGHVFLLDMTWAPWIDLADYTHNGIGSGHVLVLLIKALGFALSVALIQKLLLTGILFAMAWNMYRLAEYVYSGKEPHPNPLLKKERGSKKSPSLILRGAGVVAGIMFLVNPWVYERFLAGHWMVLLGYALFPLFVRLWLCALEKPSNKTVVSALVLTLIFPLLSLHWTFMGSAFIALLLLLHVIQRRKKITSKNIKKVLAVSIVFVVLVVLVHSFWLPGFVSHTSTFSGISLDDFNIFATVMDEQVGPWVSGLSLYGFWSTDYVLPRDTLNWWWVYPLIFAGLAVIGISWLVSGKENPLPASPLKSGRRALGISVAVAGVASLLVGIGFAHEWTRAIVTWMYEWIPGFKGLRETAKALGVLSFVYALCAPLGACVLAKHITRLPAHIPKQTIHGSILVIVAAMSVFSTHTMVRGFDHQIAVSDYPEGWYTANEILEQTPSVSRVVFLPWHGYMEFSFTHQHVVSNPARRFFASEIIAGENIDNIRIAETVQPEWDEHIFRFTHGLESVDEFVLFLQRKNISHILLAHEVDWQQYTTLAEHESVVELFSDESISLYEITK